MSARFVGIDVGARELHCAALDEDGGILDRTALPASGPEGLARWCAGAAAIAVDAPEGPSRAPHADLTELAPKFRMARCAEIELGRLYGSWVSWVPPRSPPFPAWMVVGFAVFEALHRTEGATALEVYPFAGFRELAAGRRLASKQSVAGRGQRRELLRRAGVTDSARAGRSHHDVDAILAAVVARDHARVEARRVTCGHDGSAIWLPKPLPA